MPTPEPVPPVEERLQKILSRAGLASRRQAEAWIEDGRVEVNGRLVRRLGEKADPQRDDIRVDGRRVHPAVRRIVVALYKPRGVITSLHDPQGRTTVRELVARVRERVYPIGRLDYHSEGLLLMTNDGELAARLMAPRSHCAKVYEVKVRGYPEPETLRRLARGVELEGLRTLPASVRWLRGQHNAWLEVRLVEGRKNQIRKMLLHAGHPVMKLRRVRIGPLGLGNLRPGEFRVLSEAEVERLWADLRDTA
jgi:pseudouridine synthase